jgi:hypothetical protein
MHIEVWQAAAGVGFAALAIEASRGTAVPMSDLGFAALLWATILAVDSTKTWTWGRVAVVTALGFAAIAYRLVGVIIIPAVALYAAITWGRHRGRALVPAVAWSATGLGLLAGPLAGTRGGVSLPSLAGIVDGLPSKIREYRYGLMDALLYPFPWDRWNDGYHVAAGMVIVLWRARRSLLAIAVVAYLVFLAIVPVYDARYLWPLFPLFGAAVPVALFAGLTRLTSLSPLTARRVVVSTTTAIVVAALGRELRLEPPPRGLDAPDAIALFEWVREARSHAPVRVVFNNPRVLTLETGVPAMGNVVRTAPGHLAAYVERGITHLIVQRDDSECVQRIAGRVPDLFPGRFVLEFENPTFRVYRILPGEAPGAREYERITRKQRARFCSLP